VTREVSRKISRDSFVSYNGNRYSVPYKYAGREARVQIEGRRLRIFAGSDKVCEHEILAGSHRVSRDKEHFRGLLSEVLLENKSRSNRGSPVLRFNDPVVESRPLSVYEKFSGGYLKNYLEIAAKEGQSTIEVLDYLIDQEIKSRDAHDLSFRTRVAGFPAISGRICDQRSQDSSIHKKR